MNSYKGSLAWNGIPPTVVGGRVLPSVELGSGLVSTSRGVGGVPWSPPRHTNRLVSRKRPSPCFGNSHSPSCTSRIPVHPKPQHVWKWECRRTGLKRPGVKKNRHFTADIVERKTLHSLSFCFLRLELSYGRVSPVTYLLGSGDLSYVVCSGKVSVYGASASLRR